MPTDTTYQALIQERADVTAEARKTIDAAMAREDHAMTDEEKERDDAIKVLLGTEGSETESRSGLNGFIATLEEQRDRERTVAMTPGEAQPMVINHDVPGFTKPNTPDGGPFLSLGDQLQSIHAAEMGDIRARERLVQVEAFHKEYFQAAAQGAGSAIDSDGGFLIQTTHASEIMQRMNEVGVLLSRVRRIPLDANSNAIKLPMVDESSRKDGSRWGGIRGYWNAEGIEPTTSKPKFAQLNMELHKVGALGYATTELLNNAPAMTSFFTEGFAQELVFKVEDAIFEGDGAGKPHGFTEANAVIEVQKETSQTKETVTHDNLKKMWARMDSRSRANAVWYINQDVEPTLDDLVKVIGTAGVEPSYVTFAPDGTLRIKGRPVEVTEYASTVGTVDDIVLANLGQY